MSKTAIYYIVTICLFGALIWYVLDKGESLERAQFVVKETQKMAEMIAPKAIFKEFSSNIHHPLPTLILQILSIIITARLFAWLMSKLGQPTVIGEILAGIFLGPSIVGALFPQVTSFIFPPDSLKHLQFLSQIGLILFMFIIGMDLDLSILKKNAQRAIIVSHTSIVFLYFLGVGLSCYLYTDYAPKEIPFAAFALFMGIALSITAFPVLARIVQERDMTKTQVGIMAITCAASDDVTAWCLLAIVIAIVKAGAIAGAFMTIILAVIYVLFMLYVMKPILNKMAYKYFTKESVSRPVIAIILSVLFLSSYMTEIIGIHALFGAFIAGIIIPTNHEFRRILDEKIKDLSLVLLLPLFFVFTGLRTQIGLLNDIQLWKVCGVIVAVAALGKFLGVSAASKIAGQTWKNSLILGALMNTRGLMELVVLNIGYDLGVLTPEIFAMMVIMALATTFMTGPALNLINFISQKMKKTFFSTSEMTHYKILISFGSPQIGSRILKLVYQMTNLNSEDIEITALHLSPSADISISEAKNFEKQVFEPILTTAKEFEIRINTQFKPALDVTNDIINYANTGNFDLMLVGSSRSLFSNDETGGKVAQFFADINCSVGVLIDKGFNQVERILLIVDDSSDKSLLSLVNIFLVGSIYQLSIVDNNSLLLKNTHVMKLKSDFSNVKINRIEMPNFDREFLDKYDLILVSNRYWKQLRQAKTQWLKDCPSILIVNK